MLSEVLGEVVTGASHNVDNTAWKVGGVEDLVEVEGSQRILLARHNDDCVAAHDSRREQGDKAEQRELIGAGNAHWANSLVHLHSGTVERGLLHSAAVLVGIRTPVEETSDRGVDLDDHKEKNKHG